MHLSFLVSQLFYKALKVVVELSDDGISHLFWQPELVPETRRQKVEDQIIEFTAATQFDYTVLFHKNDALGRKNLPVLKIVQNWW